LTLMRTFIVFCVLLGFALAQSVTNVTHPNSLGCRLQASKNSRCGLKYGNGARCPQSGEFCSRWGWCGKTLMHRIKSQVRYNYLKCKVVLKAKAVAKINFKRNAVAKKAVAKKAVAKINFRRNAAAKKAVAKKAVAKINFKRNVVAKKAVAKKAVAKINFKRNLVPKKAVAKVTLKK
jgi:hypothetical protein